MVTQDFADLANNNNVFGRAKGIPFTHWKGNDQLNIISFAYSLEKITETEVNMPSL
jgi:hypothetical protein